MVLTQDECIKSLKKDLSDLEELRKLLNKSYADEKGKNELLIQQSESMKKELEKMKFLQITTESEP
jgi:pimeloyl-CoA synthetase